MGYSKGSQRAGYDSLHAQTSTKWEFLRANWITQLVETDRGTKYIFFLIIILTSQQDWAHVG